MTIAVDLGCKATKPTNQPIKQQTLFLDSLLKPFVYQQLLNSYFGSLERYEIPHYVAFHPGQHCLLRQIQYSEEETLFGKYNL